MNNRVYAIDVLRCLAIVGMVLSGQICWNAELPAWLFHAQVPPPAFVFDPTVAGITWVDLVFPFFLFSMGAAFPLALRNKIKNGISSAKIGRGIVKRALLLAIFAIALKNTRVFSVANGFPQWTEVIVPLTAWALFFAMFVNLKQLSARANSVMNAAGALTLVAALVVGKFAFGMPVSVYTSDIIILILANMALFGSAIWWFTRDSIMLRMGVIAIIVALKISSSVDDSWTQQLWNFAPVAWLSKMEFLKYLCIVLPGTIVGDYIYEWSQRGRSKQTHVECEEHERGEKSEQPSDSRLWTMLLMVALVLVNMWGLFTRNTDLNFVVSVALSTVLLVLMRRGGDSIDRLHLKIVSLGLFWLLLGLIIEPFEGGIRKDTATISFFFVTSGLASLVLTAVSAMMNFYKVNMNFVIKCGQNPMIAYTASAYVVVPLFKLFAINWILVGLCAMGPWYGVLRGAIVTALMMIITYGFTRARLFWKT